MWKRLVEDLAARGHESPYLERLRERLPGRSLESRGIEREILEEMAFSLGRAEDKVNVALLELDVMAKDATTTPEAFNAKRREAVRALRDLLIQREALGFLRNESLAKLYPIPPARQVKDRFGGSSTGR
jgi:hypothetical protein